MSDYLRVTLPLLLIAWCWFLVHVLWKPQRFRNSFYLMGAIGATLIFIASLFGDYSGYALLYEFLGGCVCLFLVPVMLIWNGCTMLKKESRSLGNLLSLLLGVGIAIGEIATVLMVLSSTDWILPEFTPFFLLISFSVIYVSVLILSFVLYSVFIQIMPHRWKFDYIIVHGSGLIHGNQVSRLLADRLDKGIKVFNKCKEKPWIICSGGQGGDETVAEAVAMKSYLLSKGIEEQYILLEDKSKTTMENLIFSKKIIDEREFGKRTALVSSNYHIYRCLCYAKKLKMNITGIGSRVAFYFWPSALIREFVAIFSGWKYILFALAGYVLFAIIPFVGLISN